MRSDCRPQRNSTIGWLFLALASAALLPGPLLAQTAPPANPLGVDPASAAYRPGKGLQLKSRDGRGPCGSTPP